MTQNQILRLRNMLTERRREILDRVNRLEGGWSDLGEREIELEEEAQKASIAEPYDRLDGSAKREIEQIDLAFTKMAMGDYGICESCGDDIAARRLEAIPWARLCVDCAREYELKGAILPPAVEEAASSRVPEEYQGLPNDQLAREILQRLTDDVRIDTDELKVTVRSGVVTLEGAIPSEAEHRIVLEILTGAMDFHEIVDHLEVAELIWENEERIPGSPPIDAVLGEELFFDQDEMTDDVYSMRDNESSYATSKEPAQQPI